MSGEEISNFDTRGRLALLDYIIFISLIVVYVLIGVIVAFKEWKKTSTKDFLVGGRNMHPIPVGMSLIAGVLSAIAVLGVPAETYLHGTQIAMNILGGFWGILVVMFLILPTLYPLELVSIMQYMEMRFQSKLLKNLGSICQLIYIAFYMGICLYTPFLALSSVTDLPNWISILCIGLVCTFYVSIGGVKAVIYTDVLQALIMVIGILAAVIVVCIDLGGVGVAFERAEKGKRIEFFNFDPSPFTRHTFWSLQFMGLYFTTSILGLTQPQFQRFNAVSSLGISQGLCVIFLIGFAVSHMLFYFSGIVAYATYFDCDPLASKRIDKADQIIPFLVADKLGHLPGMAGLFLAAIYGAVLSSISSCANGFAALIWDDFLKEWQWFRTNVKVSATNITRILSMIAGVIAIGIAFFVSQLGSVIQIALTIIGALNGPISGLFITAILAPWVNVKGALVGFVTSFAFNVWLLYGQLIYGAGKASPLPLSINGCQVNSTALQFQEASTLPNNVTLEDVEKFSRTSHSVYDISYCYLGTMGILIVFIISTIVSIMTDLPNPDDIDSKLVYGPSLSFYKQVWKCFKPSEQFEKIPEKDTEL